MAQINWPLSCLKNGTMQKWADFWLYFQHEDEGVNRLWTYTHLLLNYCFQFHIFFSHTSIYICSVSPWRCMNLLVKLMLCWIFIKFVRETEIIRWPQDDLWGWNLCTEAVSSNFNVLNGFINLFSMLHCNFPHNKRWHLFNFQEKKASIAACLMFAIWCQAVVLSYKIEVITNKTLSRPEWNIQEEKKTSL